MSIAAATVGPSCNLKKISKDLINFDLLSKELLSPWSECGITEQSIAQTYSGLLSCYKNRMGIYEICNNELYLFGNSNPSLARKINEILSTTKIPNIRFIYYNSPGSNLHFDGFLVAPILCQCANTQLSDY